MLYYHGDKKWDFPNIADHFKEYPVSFKKYLPSFQTEFVNLQALTQQQILNLTHGLLATGLLAQKNHKGFKTLDQSIIPILENLRPYLGENFAASIFVYMTEISNFDKETFKEKIMTLPVTQELKAKAISVYDQLIQEGQEVGYAKGIEKGRYEGINEGIERGLEKTIVNAFDNQISLETMRVITGEKIEKIKEILAQNNRKI